jgi:hypothetical protein
MSDKARPTPRKAKPGQRKKKKYHYPVVRIEDAAALQQRIAAGAATPAEAEEYRRAFNELRRKFRDGQLSPASARRLGIE